MRIRTIKPEFFKSDHLAELDPIERLLFIGLWCCADANGVLENRPKRIKAEVLPYDDLDVSQVLPRLQHMGFVVLYEADGLDLISIVGFQKHQRITGKEATNGGRYPLPPKDLKEKKQRGNTRETPGKHPDAQEQGTGNREQGTGSREQGAGSAREGTAESPDLADSVNGQRPAACLPAPNPSEDLFGPDPVAQQQAEMDQAPDPPPAQEARGPTFADLRIMHPQIWINDTDSTRDDWQALFAYAGHEAMTDALTTLAAEHGAIGVRLCRKWIDANYQEADDE